MARTIYTIWFCLAVLVGCASIGQSPAQNTDPGFESKPVKCWDGAETEGRDGTKEHPFKPEDISSDEPVQLNLVYKEGDVNYVHMYYQGCAALVSDVPSLTFYPVTVKVVDGVDAYMYDGSKRQTIEFGDEETSLQQDVHYGNWVVNPDGSVDLRQIPAP